MGNSISSVSKMSSAAQKELQAFLCAVSELFGDEKTQRAGEFWLKALESSEGVMANGEKFFRQITIQAANLLAKDTRQRPSASASLI